MSRPALDKMGFKPGMAGWVLGRPDTLIAMFPLPEHPGDTTDFILSFVMSIDEAAARLAEIAPHYRRGGGLWFAYLKRTGALRADINRDHGWGALTAHDLLPVTQIAIDETWSALRFRYRNEIAVLTRKMP